MFRHLAGYDAVFVTGPQRSGTRICAQMIAHDTGHNFLDERYIQVEKLYLTYALWLANREFVLQCPGLMRYIHCFDDASTAIVVMHRPICDIVASEARIGWDWHPVEHIRYGLPPNYNAEGDADAGVAVGPHIAQCKYDYWAEVQRPRIHHAHVQDVAYADLADHPLWVARPARADFGATQTAPGDARQGTTLADFISLLQGRG